MMMSKIIFVLLGLQISSFTVESIRCYQCTSTNEGPCFEPGDRNASSVICSPETEEHSCYYTRITHANTSDVVIKRDCVLQMLVDQFCDEFEDEGVNGDTAYAVNECEVCDDDLCNNSEHLGMFSIAAGLVWTLLITKLV